MMPSIKYYIQSICVLLLCFSCVEEIPLESESEITNYLVIEATITDQLVKQRVQLSRTYGLEEEGPQPESNATINVNVSNGVEYEFEETNPGIYESISEFRALEDLDYSMQIITNSGTVYNSELEKLTPVSPINNLYVERGFDENGLEGVSIFVDTFNSDENSLNYRYEYEETYKIIAPLYSPQELVILNDDFDYPPNFFAGDTVEDIMDFFFLLQNRPEQEQICYNTVLSDEIILASTEELTNNDIDKFRVRFIGRNNYIMSHRYSILVRQYVQSQEAFEYYRTLSDFSLSESVFSENQLGFLEGNVFSVSNPDEKVIGLFQVSSVSEERVYFNYSDLFPGEVLPPYANSCDDFFTPILLKEDFFHNIIGSPVIDMLNQGFQFYDLTLSMDFNPFSVNPYVLVLESCGDCTVLGENIVPDFWEE
ncbi:MAG: DUF4249 domain-containing protein [Flavobacteriaceae bacterium]|nr:DUF4249 domain-containing protein [Bacteroidia bacterium]NNL61784.1 DUF4249 domain-containing protein [Flavobacteriaceae bacterium]